MDFEVLMDRPMKFKGLKKIFILATLLFLFVSAGIYASARNHETSLKQYSENGHYDMAAAESEWLSLKIQFLKYYVRAYGSFNAFLSILVIITFILNHKHRFFRSKKLFVKVINSVPPYFET